MTEELESERDRAAQLLEQRDGIILELDGAAIDEQVFAKMPPEDVELIRGALQGGPEALREGFDEEWLDLAAEDAGDTDLEEDAADPEQWTIEQRQENEAEIVRLGEEIATSNRRQEALQRYLDLLEDGDGATASAGPTIAELEAAWAAAESAPRSSGTVRLICVRVDDGVHETPERAEVTVEDGLVGDRWATGKRDLDAQITLMNVRVAELIGGRLATARRQLPGRPRPLRGRASGGHAAPARRGAARGLADPAHGVQEVQGALRPRRAEVGERQPRPAAPRHELPSGRSRRGRGRRSGRRR